MWDAYHCSKVMFDAQLTVGVGLMPGNRYCRVNKPAYARAACVRSVYQQYPMNLFSACYRYTGYNVRKKVQTFRTPDSSSSFFAENVLLIFKRCVD